MDATARPLSELLPEAGLNGGAIARRLGMHRNTVYNYLSGQRKMPIWFARKLAEMVSKPMDHIVFPGERGAQDG